MAIFSEQIKSSCIRGYINIHGVILILFMIVVRNKIIKRNVNPLHDFVIIYLYIFRQRRRESERETSMCGLSLTRPLMGTWSATQACALTGN